MPFKCLNGQTFPASAVENKPQDKLENEIIIIETDSHVNEETFECFGEDPAAKDNPKLK